MAAYSGILGSGEGGRRVVLVDMDNTLVDWDAQFERLMKTLYPDVTLVPMQHRLHWTIELNYPAEVWAKISSLSQQPEFWLSMPPMEGGVEALKEMDELGHCVYVVSTPDENYTAQCAAEKYKWLEKHMGKKWKDKLILTFDKTIIRGDILVDDKPTASSGVMLPTWRHVLFSHAYNEMYSQTRLRRWADWKDVFKQLEMQNENKQVDGGETEEGEGGGGTNKKGQGQEEKQEKNMLNDNNIHA